LSSNLGSVRTPVVTESRRVTSNRARSPWPRRRVPRNADRLRAETGYRWRFQFERLAFEQTVARATHALGESFDTALREGRHLDWREAVAYASRGRGARKRPRAGWDSLTETEDRVVALVVQGLTNPQIAAELMMSRATVKTHLEHIFLKVAVRTRSQLAAQAAQAAQRRPGIDR
jgi:DNA-binding CsgD family transcriptional regulator